jgi:hypothetical protein
MSYDRSGEGGLERVYAYHCSRCNYVWLPKDYDFIIDDSEALFRRDPPKACARCKSKQWMSLRSRKTKHEGEYALSVSSVARLRALHRQGQLGYAVNGCNCKYCNPISS